MLANSFHGPITGTLAKVISTNMRTNILILMACFALLTGGRPVSDYNDLPIYFDPDSAMSTEAIDAITIVGLLFVIVAIVVGFTTYIWYSEVPDYRRNWNIKEAPHPLS